MNLTRRHALALIAVAPLPTRAEEAPTLTPKPARARLIGPEAPSTVVWGYDGTVPGPEIRLRQGRRVRRRLVNALPQPTSVHWHGIRIDNAMDGVAGLTQPAVGPGEDFLYDFVAPDAGTWWYHPHNRTFEQMARGLYGPLIVDEAEPPDVDEDVTLMIDDWRLDAEARIDGGFERIFDLAHGGRIGNWITVNGEGAWVRKAAARARIRLRLINAANARIFDLEARGLNGWVVALDGMPLETPTPLERFQIAPAQRADLIVDLEAEPGGEALLISHERDGGYAIAAWEIGAERRRAALAPPAPLPPNPVPDAGSLAEARVLSLTMEGGAMGGLPGAVLDGEMQSPRELAAAGMVWAFNGQAGMTAAPMAEVALGESIAIRMENRSAWPHAMHLHGHHFRKIGPDGSAGPLRDTLLMAPRETATILFIADNPGDWLLHCHMLEHAASGMMTWLKVG